MSPEVGARQSESSLCLVLVVSYCNLYRASEQAHALQEPHQWYLEDRSTNGTCVNAERVPKGSSRPLREGDRIKLAALTEDSEKIVQ